MIKTLRFGNAAPQKLLLVLLFSFFGFGAAQAQVSAYQLEQLQGPTFAVLPIAGRTTLVAASSTVDDQIYAVTMPITFEFNGAVQNTIKISTNGFVGFGTDLAVNDYTPISSSTVNGGIISVFGADIDIINSNNLTVATNPNVSYATTGTAPNRIMKIQWNGQRTNGAAALDGTRALFQLWLYETSNIIEMHYAPMAPTATTDFFAQIGLRGTNNTEFKNVSYEVAAPWPGIPTAPAGTMPLGTVNTARVLTDNVNTILANSNRLFRFTPPTCFAPTNLAVSPIGSSTATLSWTAPSPTPGTGYEYYFSTSPAAPAAGTTPSGSVAVGTNTVNLSGLAVSTQYYVWVRSVCSGTSTSGWSSIRPFKTLCGPQNIPYLQYFEPTAPGYAYAVPAIPPCNAVETSTGNNWRTSPASVADGFVNEHLLYQGNATQANSYYYTQGINLVAGQTYRLKYVYGGSTTSSFLTNRMTVKLSATQDNTGYFAGPLIAQHLNIKGSPLENIVNFPAQTTGTFYLAFLAHSDANMGRIFLDNIELTDAVCFSPTTLAAGNQSGTTALITWNAPSAAPVGGYAYYLSPSSTPPAYTQTPTGFTTEGTTALNLTGLTVNTTYYLWVRSNCGDNDFSQWSAMLTFATLNPPVYTYCNPSPTSVDGQGIVNVTVGSINNSTGTEPNNYGNYSAMITNVSEGTPVVVAITYNTSIFNYNTKIWVDWNNDSDFNDAGEEVFTGLSASTSPNTLTATFNVPAGTSLGEHRMRIGGKDYDSPIIDPCYSGVFATFEDYTLKVIIPPPALTLNISSSQQCAGDPSPLVTITSPMANFNTYSWSPTVGVSGNATTGYTFTSATSITYTVTGIQTVSPYSTNTASFTYIANPLPTTIVITPLVPAVCQGGPAVQLNASGGMVSGVPIINENFNGTAPGWLATSESTGGAPAAAAWTLRNSGYAPGGSSGIPSVVSNDATRFYISNSDAQGSGSTTLVRLESPEFSLVGYTDASMSFFHYYKAWNNGSARVEIFSGGAWNPVPLMQWGMGAAQTQGTATNFKQVIYNLGAYVGQANLKIRFTYSTQWGYVWAIDNFMITGSATSAITWSPVAGLFTDSAATIPYTGGGAGQLYALPSATTTYTATASTLVAPVCSTSTNTTVTVSAVAGGSASPVAQDVCSAPAPIVLTGAVGTVVRWEYATDAAFTAGVTNIASSASATLSAAQIGSFTGIRYFRAVITSGGCTGYSNVVSVTNGASSTWNGTIWVGGAPDSTKKAIFNGNYSSTGNINACSVEVLSGTVTFNPDHVLHAVNEVTVTGGALIFENNSSLVQVNDLSVNSGAITYRRNSTPMVAMDYTYWSSPVASQTLYNLSPLTLSDKFMTYTALTSQWLSMPPATPMVAATGYIIRAPQGHTANTMYAASFTGVPHNGVKTIPIVSSGTNIMNLIGNPYPSAVNANMFLAANAAITESSLYFWTHNTPLTNSAYVNSDYAIYNLTGGVGTGIAGGGTGNSNQPNGTIAAGQGFFIKGRNAGGNAVFNNSMRLAGNNNWFFRTDVGHSQPETTLEKHRIWLQMVNATGAYKQMLAGYIETATDEIDGMFDATIVEAGNPISLYSLVGDARLSIQGRALPFNNDDQIPLGYRSSVAGAFQIGMADFDGLFTDASVGIYLEDKMLNVIHDLRSGGYAFTTATGTYHDRFVLRFTDQALGIDGNDVAGNAVVVYKNVTGINIHSGTMVMKTVRIYDIRGRELLVKTNVNASETVIANLSAASQVLLVQITGDDNTVVTRKIVY